MIAIETFSEKECKSYKTIYSFVHPSVFYVQSLQFDIKHDARKPDGACIIILRRPGNYFELKARTSLCRLVG